MKRGTSRLAITAAMVAALAATPSFAFAEETWERLYGDNAYDTMQEIVDWGDAFEPDSVDTVIIATGKGYHDALAASGLAGLFDAPVLITPTDELCEQARAELEWLKPSTVYIVGGPNSVSSTVFEQISELGVKVERLSGGDAVQTAIETYRKGAGSWGATAVIASSKGYYDAMSAAPYSYWADAPLFLANKDGLLSDETAEAIAEGGFERVLVAGGNLNVADGIADQLPEGIEIVRKWGANALETSAEVASWAMDEGMTSARITVATSKGYHDALTGAALSGKRGMALVLVKASGGLEGFDAVKAKMLSDIESLNEEGVDISFEGGFVLGGPNSVSEATYTYITTGELPVALSLPGEWTLVGDAINTDVPTEDVIRIINEAGYDTPSIVVNEDGTFELDVFGHTFKGSWSKDGDDNVSFELSGGVPFTIKLDGNRLLYDDGTNSYLFGKK